MNKLTSTIERSNIVQQLTNQTYDILVIGGGITGAGIALDAASRGYKTALVEMQDFASGTSSRSSKMIHGGLRYLKNYEIKIVSEVGRERAIVYENGPHITSPEKMILPIYKNADYGVFMTSIGLSAYDLLAGVKKEERKNMLKIPQLLAMEPKIKQQDLLGGGYFIEYRSDDARLTIEVMKEAIEKGATTLNYAKVSDLLYTNNKISGANIFDEISGESFQIHAKKVINACGPWIDQVQDKYEDNTITKLHLSKGVHLVFSQEDLPLNNSLYFDTPDGRMVLIIPRDGKTYVGTTDTNYQGDIHNPSITHEDVDYLLRMMEYIFPHHPLSKEQIETAWAGIRPLIEQKGKSESSISRKNEIWTSPAGLITIAGGKLTGYRKMAESIVNLVSKQLHNEFDYPLKPCLTRKLPVSGGHVGGSKHWGVYSARKQQSLVDLNIPTNRAQQLVKRYGSNIDILIDFIKSAETDAQKYNVPVDLYAEVLYSIQYELTAKPVDFFVRRTSAMLFQHEWLQQWKAPVITIMKDLLLWDEATCENYTAELEQYIRIATTIE
ncbi:glycerol-3-phosphate dehydrogenase [Lysinibacillus contaminans]|uniref:Glycerol-3-phosphate dehydrogenase n=1 Tax=Lysinibacillus contaminans TaxID=1293441 RepID=A0ABR5JYV4_9BACI|nr:glycerol-3-phosphate dehydrogenase/oxidase [Lysinibacillus contaminans]KOS67813.1 glycerol-3-phosphate dehydrogenase [Lysinibacillus contaminans]